MTAAVARRYRRGEVGESTVRDHVAVEAGDRMLLWCTGGPSLCRAVTYPPPAEIDVEGGLYVLVDDEAVEVGRYDFISD